MRKLKLGIIPKSVLGWNGGVDFFLYLLSGLTVKKVSRYVELQIIGTIEDRKKIYEIILEHKIAFHEINEFTKDCIAAEIIENDMDVVFSFQTDLGKYMPVPWIGYIPDFQHKYLSSYFSEAEISNRDKSFSEIFAHSDGLIVNSLDTKNDIKKFLCAGDEKIYTLPFTPFLKNNYNDNLANIVEDDLSYLSNEKYFMISNQFWIHKNHKLAFEAFKLFHEKNPHLSEIMLVCTGELSDYRNEDHIKKLKSFINKNKLQGKIILLGLVEKQTQLKLMKNCLAIIQPTLFEGGPGGGSTYDALALEKRVVLSNIAINLEIDNPNVVFFKSDSAVELRQAMENILVSDEIVSKKLDNEKNKIALGNSLYGIIKNVLDKNKYTRSEYTLFDYTSLNANIKRAERLDSCNSENKKSNILFSSLLILDKNCTQFNKAISAKYFAQLYIVKHNLVKIKFEQLLYLEDELFTISLSNYIGNYVLHNVAGNSSLYIYADGGHTELLLENVDFSEFELKGIISKNPKANMLGSYPVLKYSLDLIHDNTYFLISSASYEDEIYLELSRDVPKERIIRIYGY